MQRIRRPDGIALSRRWFGAGTVFLTFFAVFWDGFLVFWYTNVPAEGPTALRLLPLAHVAAGVWLTYTAAAGWLNRTRIAATMREIAVKNGPLPWPGNRRLPTTTVRQLHCRERHRGRRKSRTTYEVHATTSEGKNVKLVSGLESSEQAHWVEQELEAFLGIRDHAVRGELSRSG